MDGHLLSGPQSNKVRDALTSWIGANMLSTTILDSGYQKKRKRSGPCKSQFGRVPFTVGTYFQIQGTYFQNKNLAQHYVRPHTKGLARKKSDTGTQTKITLACHHDSHRGFFQASSTPISSAKETTSKEAAKRRASPGIEPGPPRPERGILPLN